MKKVIGILVVVLLYTFSTSVFAWGKKDTGEVTGIMQDGAVPFATVEGYTSGGKLWLGFSYKCTGNRWIDRKPKKVKGSFSKQFTMSLCPQGYSAIRSCLWEGKSGGKMKGRVDCLDH